LAHVQCVGDSEGEIDGTIVGLDVGISVLSQQSMNTPLARGQHWPDPAAAKMGNSATQRSCKEQSPDVVGEALGDCDGLQDGLAVGETLGDPVGLDGLDVGDALGDTLGADGLADGLALGEIDCSAATARPPGATPTDASAALSLARSRSWSAPLATAARSWPTTAATTAISGAAWSRPATALDIASLVAVTSTSTSAVGETRYHTSSSTMAQPSYEPQKSTRQAQLWPAVHPALPTSSRHAYICPRPH